MPQAASYLASHLTLMSAVTSQPTESVPQWPGGAISTTKVASGSGLSAQPYREHFPDGNTLYSRPEPDQPARPPGSRPAISTRRSLDAASDAINAGVTDSSGKTQAGSPSASGIVSTSRFSLDAVASAKTPTRRASERAH